MNGVFGEGSQRLHFLLVPGLRGREAPGRMLREMPAYGMHHSAAGRTDRDAEGGSSGSQDLDHRLLPCLGIFSSRKRGPSLGRY